MILVRRSPARCGVPARWCDSTLRSVCPRIFLDVHFPSRWFGIDVLIPWLPRSLDVIQFDFLLWESLEALFTRSL